MELAFIDWAIMLAYFAVTIVIGVMVTRQAGQDFDSFFLGGRQMPWWLLGVSMVATTFSADTPNLVANIVRTRGTYGNWTWWAFLLTGMLTVFVYAKLWRRSRVRTDIAFYEIRYSGAPAAFLRAIRGVYLGLIFNVIIMGSVTLAAIKIGGALLGLTPLETVLVAVSITMIYSALGGLSGVLLTDFIQFFMAMAGSIGAAWYVTTLPEIGSLHGLITHENVQPVLNFWPNFAELSWTELMPVFIVPLAVQWWATYYPGAEPGGGGYIVQRMLSAKDEKNSVGATLLFNALHYALRPWPWIIVALASLIIFPDLQALNEAFPELPKSQIQDDLAYPAMLTFLPKGLLGLIATSLAAAYMSTMSTQANWGSSILVNDIYERFYNPEASPNELVWAGRISTVVLMALAAVLALFLESALQMFEILLQIGAGTGLVFLLRWFWWRINAMTEIVAMVVAFLVAMYFQFVASYGLTSWEQLLVGTLLTTVAWVITAYTTPHTNIETLVKFYQQIQPGGPGWNRIIQYAEEQGYDVELRSESDLPYALVATLVGCIGIYSILFSTGFYLYGDIFQGTIFAVISAISIWGVFQLWHRLSFE